jgi:hypothetical protein
MLAASEKQPGFGSHHNKETSQTHSHHIYTLARSHQVPHQTCNKFLVPILIRACLDGVLRKLPEPDNNVLPLPSRFLFTLAFVIYLNLGLAYGTHLELFFFLKCHIRSDKKLSY